MRKRQILGVVVIVSILSSIVGANESTENWPKYIKDSLWIPGDAMEVERYVFSGIYHSNYKITVNYPGETFIDAIVKSMNKGGWQRLEYNYANPAIKNNYAATPKAIWGYTTNKSGSRIWTWFENWKDSKGNIVECMLLYKTGINGIINTSNNNLEVKAIFIPKESLPDSIGK